MEFQLIAASSFYLSLWNTFLGGTWGRLEWGILLPGALSGAEPKQR